VEIKGILVTLLAPMTDHIANGGEKILGNASSIKQRPDGRVYISGQKQRHALFAAMERLNLDDEARAGTYISNGDGVTTIVEKDLRADLGGFLDTNKGNYSGRRTAPLTATPAVAMESSEIGRDLLIRLKLNLAGDREQALATREYSQEDLMLMNFHMDVGAVSIRKFFRYEGERHLETKYVKHVSEDERKRRIRLALEATASLTDYANNARNATSGEPQTVLIVFDTKLSRKASRYFRAEEVERKNLLAELDKRGATYFRATTRRPGATALPTPTRRRSRSWTRTRSTTRRTMPRHHNHAV
jgi:CRISPR-associated protein Cst2